MSRPASQLDVYFQLSHSRWSTPNKWIQRFHQSLEIEVQSRAEPADGLHVGSLFFATDAIAREALAAGTLPDARVLVPLYTREFLHAPPPEYVRFRDTHEHTPTPGAPLIHPVLWEPHPGGRNVIGLSQARSVGVGIPDYEECGLAAMCRLNAYARHYKELVERLAERIVGAAEHPDRVPAWTSGETAAPPAAPNEAPFVISVVAPQGATWNPYPSEQRGSLAEHTAAVAGRLLLLPEIIDYATVGSSADGIADAPGILLVDPWALAQDATRAIAEHVLRHPPRWVTVVLVVDQDHPDHETTGRTLVGRAAEFASGAVTVIHDVREFDHDIEDVVQRTRRSYLRQQPINPPRASGAGTAEGDRR